MRLIGGKRVVRQAKRFARGRAGATHQFIADHTHDGFAVVGGDDRLHAHAVIGARRIRIPTAPHDGVAHVKQQAVARVFQRARGVGVCWRGRTRIHQPPVDVFAAAVGHVIDQPVVSACRIHRTEHEKIRFVFDAACGVAWRFVEVDDDLVACIGGIEFALKGAAHALVGTATAEAGAVGERFDGDDIEFKDTGGCGIHGSMGNKQSGD